MTKRYLNGSQDLTQNFAAGVVSGFKNLTQRLLRCKEPFLAARLLRMSAAIMSPRAVTRNGRVLDKAFEGD
jgi:hypothetical protein